MLDEIDKEKRRLDGVKALLATKAADFDLARSQFPEYFKVEDPYEAARNDDGTYDVDALEDADLDWSTPATPEDDDEISRWIAQQESASVSASELPQID
jgi:hypothetical protein